MTRSRHWSSGWCMVCCNVVFHCAGEPIHCTGVCTGVQGNQHSPDLAKRLMATNVQSDLTFWNHGLSDEVYIPSPSTPVKSTANSDNGEGEFVMPRHTMLHAVHLADLQLPVSMDALCQEFDAVTALIMAADIPNGTPDINMCHQSPSSSNIVLRSPTFYGHHRRFRRL